MNSKKLASIVVLVAGMLFIALVIQNLGDKKFERNEYAKPVIKEETISAEEMARLEKELYDAKLNVDWQSSRLATLLGEPSVEKVSAEKSKVEKTKIGLKKALADSYAVALNASKKGDVPFVKTYTEIVAKKKQIDTMLAIWKDAITAGNPPGASTASGYLGQVNDYLEDVQTVLNTITPKNSGLTQEQINEYKEDIIESIAEVTNAVTAINEAQTTVQNAEEDLNAAESVGNPQAIEEQTQKLIEAQAEVADIEEAISEVPPSSTTIPPVTPTYVDIDEEPLDPNIKVVPLYDPNKPHLRQD